MPICYMNAPKMGESELPNLYQVGSYKIFFWSNENNEPVHVHITSGNPKQSAAFYSLLHGNYWVRFSCSSLDAHLTNFPILLYFRYMKIGGFLVSVLSVMVKFN